MGKVKVLFGQLTKQLVAKNVDEGSTLGDFLSANEMKSDSSIRVNGLVKALKYVLEEGDIITSIEDIDGGTN